MTYELHCIDQFEEIAKRRDDWFRLASEQAVVAPFCRPEAWLGWLETFLEYEPLVFELRDESGQLRAVLPLYENGLKLRVATDDHLDYQDILADSNESAVQLLKRIIETERGEGFSLTFGKVAEHSRLHAALHDERLESIASIQGRYWSICPATQFAVPESREFLPALSSRQRKDYRASTRRTADAFPDHVVEARWGKEIQPSEIEAAGQLHQANQYRKEGDSVFADPGFADFLKRQAEREVPLLLTTLRERPNGAPIAFSLGYFARDTYYYYMTTYEGRHSELSPGRKIMIDSLIECAKRLEGNTLRFDMLSGEESYKSRWAKSFYQVNRFQVIPKRLGNLPRMAAYSTVYGLKEAKNRWRSRLGVGDRITEALEHERPILPS